MSIIIDTREDQAAIWEELALLDVSFPDFKFEKLDVGDFLIENGPEKLLIERKEIHDFCSTYGDLKDRMDRMRAQYDRTALLIEGYYTVQETTVMLWHGNHRLVPSIPHRTLTNFIASQQARGSYLFWTNDLKETLTQISHLHDYLPTMGLNPARKTKSAVEWFAQLPGIGLLTSFGLREKYKNPTEAIRSIDEWIPKKSKSMFSKW